MMKPKANADVYKKFSKLAYKQHAGEIEKELGGTGFRLDASLSDKQHKVFYNPETKKVVVAYTGTNPRSPSTLFGDLRSDYSILMGREGKDSRFKQAVKQFKAVMHKYQNQGYSLDTTGHSLGGSLATYVTKKLPNQVTENLSYDRGSGLKEPFRTRPQHTWDYSHAHDPISLGARLNKGNKEHSVVSHTQVKNMLQAHDIDRLQTQQMSAPSESIPSHSTEHFLAPTRSTQNFTGSEYVQYL